MTSSREYGRSDQSGVRRANLALILWELRREQRSRARLAVDMGLTKATISSLVVELESRGLALLRPPAREGSMGRPGQQVELLSNRVVALGLEINVDYVAAVVLDLVGDCLASERRAVDIAKMPVGDALSELVHLAEEVVERALSADSRTLLAGIGVAVPGLVDVACGVVRKAPNLHWNDVELRDALSARLPYDGVNLIIDNDANLGALAEHRDGGVGDVNDLLYLTGEVGIGGGVMSGGRLLRGASGYAGEVGHMSVDPQGQEPCGCGRRGCWEAQCGLAAFLSAAANADDPIHDLSLDLERRLDLVVERARRGDARTVQALHAVGTKLGIGASVLVNVLNPQVLVLGGYLARLGDLLLEPMLSQMSQRVFAEDIGGTRIHFSKLGFAAGATGAAHVALEPALADPFIVPLWPNAGTSVRHLVVQEAS